MIKEKHDAGVPYDEIVEWVMATLRTTRPRAMFIVDIELGAIDGDIIYIKDDLSPILPL